MTPDGPDPLLAVAGGLVLVVLVAMFFVRVAVG